MICSVTDGGVEAETAGDNEKAFHCFCFSLFFSFFFFSFFSGLLRIPSFFPAGHLTQIKAGKSPGQNLPGCLFWRGLTQGAGKIITGTGWDKTKKDLGKIFYSIQNLVQAAVSP